MKKLKIQYLSIFILFAIPYLLIYSAFFSNKVLSWGDAPFYYPENLFELFNLPLIWDIRNSNFGSPQFFTMWLYLPTFLFGVFNHFFNSQSPLLLRLIFYFPSTIFSIIGAWIFLSLYTKNTTAKILGTIIYSFNTYFLLLLDGGQIGVALSYGLFPLVTYFLIKYLKIANAKNYYLSLISLFLLANVDLRTFILCLFFTFLLRFFGYLEKFNLSLIKKEIWHFASLLLVLIFLDAIWIVPFITGFLNSATTEIPTGVLNNNLVEILNGLFLYQSNFPLNEFGRAITVPFYYALFPILILSGLFLRGEKKFYFFVLIFFIIIFLVKGNNEPFGNIYDFITKHFPLGVAFRDSSKFFIPLFLITSLVISLSIDSLESLFKPKNFKILFLVIYFYLLILVYPAILGNLNGGLNNPVDSKSFFNIYQNLKKNDDFSRAIWFSEKPPLGYSNWNTQAVSASQLFQDRPFASQIEGSYDLFGFLHSKHLKEWFNLLGIKYAFFPQSERQKIWSPKQIQERGEFLYFINQIPFFRPLNLNTNFPAYQIDGHLPNIFAQKKIFIILGGEQIYNTFFQYSNFNLASQGLVFLEHGNFDPKRLFEIDSKSADLLLYERDKNELPFVFLQSRMLSTLSASVNEWAKNSSSEYLNWKASLFKSGINTLDFDYGKGISYSTIKGEKIKYRVNLDKGGDYILALRYINASDSSKIRINLGSFEREVKNQDFNTFHWSYFEIPTLTSGTKIIEVTNLGSAVALNTVLLISKNDYQQAVETAEKLTSHFNTYNFNDQIVSQEIQKELNNNNYFFVDYNRINPTQYKINIPNNTNWIVFTDHYNQGWNLEDSKSYPFYAMVNGFYLKKNDLNRTLVLYFTPQKTIEYGVLLSLISFSFILILISIFKFKSKFK